MTTLLLILSLFGPIDRERFLAAISAVESNHNPRAVGRAGEKTQWQISPIAFKDLRGTGSPGREHFRIQLNRMTKARVPVTPERFALVWKFGFEGAKKRKWKSHDYSKRVSNVYNDLAQPAAIPKPSRTPHVHSSARAVPLTK